MILKKNILSLLALWVGMMGVWAEADDFQKITKDGIIQGLQAPVVAEGLVRGIKGIGRVPVTGDQAKPHVALQLRFDRDSAILRSEAVLNLVKVASALEDESLRMYKFAIEGHTCDLGLAEHNLELSKRRAYAVADFLTSHTNLSPDQFKVRWHGEICPIENNINEEARKINRRVVIQNTLETADVLLKGKPLTLQIVRYRNGQREIVGDGDTLSSNSSYSLSFKSNAKQYAYVCQIDSSSKAMLLFPNHDYSSQDNPIEINRTYRIPGKEGSGFYLDEISGIERIAMLALDRPVQDSKDVCATIFQDDSAIQRGIGGVSGIRPVTNEVPVANTSVVDEKTNSNLQLCEVVRGGKTRGIGGVVKVGEETPPPMDSVALQIESCAGFFLKRSFIHE